MIDAQRSVVLAVAQERRRMFAELQALRDEVETLKAEALTALEDARAIKMEFLRYKSLVVHDRAQLAEIERERAEIAFAIAQREPDQLLQ